MKRVLIILAVFVGLHVSAQEALVGDWMGELTTPQGSIRMVMHVTEADGGIDVTLDSPDQGAYGLETDTAYLADGVFVFEVSQAQLKYTATIAGEEMRGIFKQGPYELDLAFEKSDIPIGKDARPQDPALPFDYESEEITFRNKQSKITLAGTLTYPYGAGPFPVVILISGSGPQDRNSEIFNHRPFLVWSDYLTSKGFAVLRYDERGVGDSGGKFEKATTTNFASDVTSAIDYLKSRGEVIDKKAIGLMGHSEGGIIAPMVANENKDVSFMILLAGPAMPGKDVLLDQSRRMVLASGGSVEDADENNALMAILYDLMAEIDDRETLKAAMKEAIAEAGEGEPQEDIEAMENALLGQLLEPWMQEFVVYDPRPALEKTTVSTLVLFAEKDIQVSDELNKGPMEEALGKAPVKDFQVLVMPGQNHLFQTCETGMIGEYGSIDETVNEETMKLVLKWLRKHT